MAWDPLGGSDELYSGDVPMDAFGEALAQASIAWERDHKRWPTFTELATCFRDAAAASATQIADPEEVPRLLERWLAGPSGARPAHRRIALHPGEVFEVPYARERSVYGIVLFVDSPRAPRRGPGIGTLVVICDREVKPGENPAVAREAMMMFEPFHTFDALAEGRWPILGKVPVDDTMLPRLRRGSEVTDYFGEIVAATDDDVFTEDATVSSVEVVRCIRAERGLGRRVAANGPYKSNAPRKVSR
jgi:hypothetical protein